MSGAAHSKWPGNTFTNENSRSDNVLTNRNIPKRRCVTLAIASVHCERRSHHAALVEYLAMKHWLSLILVVESADLCGRPRVGEQRAGSLSLFLYWLGKLMPTAFHTWLAIKTRQISPKSSAPNAPATVKIHVQPATCLLLMLPLVVL